MASLDEKRLGKEMAILSAILVALIALSVRPFGFRNFLHGLASNQLFSLFLIMGIVGVFFIMLQRLGIIFPDTPSRKPPSTAA